jgi:glutamyl-tRNA synthetase/glutamyl-Q tRNA(Asp) synthetase
MYVQGMASNLEADICLRLEDHDQSRCRPEFESSIIEDLTWLGVKIPTNLWRQSSRDAVYQTNLEDLMRRNLVYACSCSRKDIQDKTGQASGELIYPGTCRQKGIPFDQKDTSLRVIMPDQDMNFTDLFRGTLHQNPSQQCGDIVIRDRLRQWTYQFAVVIDDLEQEINLIIRGEDLLSSTGRQLALREILSAGAPCPTFAHHPLITDKQGHKLSKRLLSESIRSLRQKGKTADDIRGVVANLAGLTATDRPITLAEIPGLIRA